MKKFIALLLASSLAGCMIPGGGLGPEGSYAGPYCEPSSPNSQVPTPPGSLITGLIAQSQIVYHAWFPNGSLECGYVDYIHGTRQPMKYGDGRVADTTGILFGAAPSGALAMGLTAPNPIQPDTTPSVGVFSTDLNFGSGRVFTTQATFRALDGPRLPGNGWAVGVAARTGDENDLESDTRLAVVFRILEDKGAVLRVLEADDRLDQRPVDDGVVASIFNRTSPQPFTLKLVVDRQTGKGAASLTAGSYVLEFPFEMKTFLATSGPPITTIGASVANCCAPGRTVYAEVSDFQILVPSSERWLRIEPNVPTWGKPDDTRPH
jgi:hypothetical protein